MPFMDRRLDVARMCGGALGNLGGPSCQSEEEMAQLFRRLQPTRKVTRENLDVDGQEKARRKLERKGPPGHGDLLDIATLSCPLSFSNFISFVQPLFCMFSFLPLALRLSFTPYRLHLSRAPCTLHKPVRRRTTYLLERILNPHLRRQPTSTSTPQRLAS